MHLFFFVVPLGFEEDVILGAGFGCKWSLLKVREREIQRQAWMAQVESGSREPASALQVLFFFFSFIHMCIHCLGHFSLPAPHPSFSPPHRGYDF
jgi:hypothetical protein